MTKDDRIEEAGRDFVAMADAEKAMLDLVQEARCHAHRLKEAAEALERVVEWSSDRGQSDTISHAEMYPNRATVNTLIDEIKGHKATVEKRRASLNLKYPHVKL